MEKADRARDFFMEYGQLMDAGVKSGHPDTKALKACYAGYFVGASPVGIMGGEAKEDFGDIIAAGVENYRRMGATEFIVEGVATTPIDDLHTMARVSWRFGYKRPNDGVAGTIRFENVYFVSFVEGPPKIFAWVTPDEQAVLREHGLA
ncbi:hypothetical protein [Devosia nitrariae]|uniref:Nuclear transport factor 2 family protein n=1 Tax=Devosia nitrariae TaxID=2071872 RepID=A0ABQ5VYY1_9HYPH|nr:hypothetical protein [Devosia nitrariae]GLQ53030.1 hypothetical protein GCM10010862_02880 [Devosia nitrariae]